MECAEQLIRLGFGLVLIALFALLLVLICEIARDLWLDNKEKAMEIEREKERVRGRDILEYVSEIKKWVKTEIETQIATHTIDHILTRHCSRKEKK